MLDYKKNPRAHVVPKFLLHCTISLLLLVVAVLVVRAAWHMYGKFATASAAAEAAKTELSHMEEQKASVSEAIAELSSERGVEASAREKFGVAKPGEGEIRIIRDKEGVGTLPSQDDQNILSRIFNALFVW